MIASVPQAFAKIYMNQFVKSPKQWVVFVLLVVFSVFSILFYHFLFNFHSAFVDSLRRVYPLVYVSSFGRDIPSLAPGITPRKEVFQFSTGLYFRYTEDGNTKKIMDVGIRSMADAQVADLLVAPASPRKEENVIGMNPMLFHLIADSGQFDGRGIYLKSQVAGDRYLYCKVAVLDFEGRKSWMILSSALAQKLGMGFNVSTFSAPGMEEEQLFLLYDSNGFNPVRWSDRLPFFTKVVYVLSSRIYHVILFSFGLLVLFMLMGILHDTVLELETMIQFAGLYGAGRFNVYAAVGIGVSGYVFLVLGMGTLLSLTLSQIVVAMVPELGFMAALPPGTMIVFGLVPLSAVVALVYTAFIFNRKILILE